MQNVQGIDFNKMLYISFDAGHGISCYLTPTQVIPRFYISISFYQENFKRYYHSVVPTPPADINTVIPIGNQETNVRYLSQKYTAPDGGDVNEIGLRIYQMAYGKGAYPFFLLSDAKIDSGSFERCFWHPFTSSKCIGMALMHTPGDSSVNVFQRNKDEIGELKVGEDDQIMSACKMPYSKEHCIIPKQGYVVNLELKQRGVLSKNYLPQGEYDALRDDQKAFYAVYTEGGIKYLFSCPYECN